MKGPFCHINTEIMSKVLVLSWSEQLVNCTGDVDRLFVSLYWWINQILNWGGNVPSGSKLPYLMALL